MCGIAGIVSLNGCSINKSRIREMMLKMKHRGPDDEGCFIYSNVGLGFVRLSILDLSEAGHQPMADDDNRYIIILNGEIYNYIELREELKQKGYNFHTNSDTEVLLKAYLCYGKECLNALNGMFAFAIYDKQTQNIFGARDRFGVKPLYYYKSDTEFIFASEIPSILSVYGRKNEANEKAIFDYLIFNRTDQTDETFFKDIHKLQHGSYFTIDAKGNVKIERWYDLREHVLGKQIHGNPQEYRSLLEDSIRLRLRSDVPVGVCLSGGLDSSSIASVIESVIGNKDINTFSTQFGKGIKGDESSFIDLYKDKLINMFKVTPTADTLLDDMNEFIKIHSEPIPSTSPYAQYCVMRLAHKHVTVTLDGQGADEALGGYHYFYGFYYKELLKNGRLLTLLWEVFLYIYQHHSLMALKSFAFFLLPKKWRLKLRVKEKEYLNDSFAEKFNNSIIADNLYGSSSLQDALINHFEYKLEHLLKWDDKNSMAFSVESRTPFLDYRLVEYTLSLKEKYIIKDGYTKSILRQSLKGILPEPIRKRKDKVGFGTPQDEWFRENQFKRLVMDILSSKSFSDRKIINSTKAIDLFHCHCAGKINIANDIWKWINLELWYRYFID